MGTTAKIYLDDGEILCTNHDGYPQWLGKFVLDHINNFPVNHPNFAPCSENTPTEYIYLVQNGKLFVKEPGEERWKRLLTTTIEKIENMVCPFCGKEINFYGDIAIGNCSHIAGAFQTKSHLPFVYFREEMPKMLEFQKVKTVEEMAKVYQKAIDDYAAENMLVGYWLMSGKFSVDSLKVFLENPGCDSAFWAVFSPERFSDHQIIIGNSGKYSLGYYEYIPIEYNLYVDKVSGIFEIIGKTPESAIDVGCGTGNVMYILKWVLEIDRVFGVEMDRKLLEIGREIYGRLGKAFPISYERGSISNFSASFAAFNTDAFNFNFEGIEFISMYHPIEDDKKMLELYEHIMETMDIGSYMFDIYDFGLVLKTKKFKIKGPTNRFRSFFLRKASRNIFEYIEI